MTIIDDLNYNAFCIFPACCLPRRDHGFCEYHYGKLAKPDKDAIFSAYGDMLDAPCRLTAIVYADTLLTALSFLWGESLLIEGMERVDIDPPDLVV